MLIIGFLGLAVSLGLNAAQIQISKPISAHYILMQDCGPTDTNTQRWNKLGSTDNLPWKEIDILYISFARVTPDLNVLLQTTDDSDATVELTRLNELLASRKKLNPETKIILSLGGWCNSGHPTNTFNYFITNGKVDTSKATTFANNLKAYLDKYTMQGVDIDWETLPTTEQEMDLIKIVRNTLGKDYIITIAGWGSATTTGLDSSAYTYLDYVNLMSYNATLSDMESYVSGYVNKTYNFTYDQMIGGVHTYVGDGAQKDTPDTVEQKAAFVKQKGMPGLMEYEILQDDGWVLTDAMYNDLNN